MSLIKRGPDTFVLRISLPSTPEKRRQYLSPTIHGPKSYARKVERTARRLLAQGIPPNQVRDAIKKDGLSSLAAQLIAAGDEAATAKQMWRTARWLRANEDMLARGERAGFVYFAAAAGYYKIGRTGNPSQRYQALRLANPGLSVTHQIETDDMAQLERLIHDDFSECRLTGEWFAIRPDDPQFAQWMKRTVITFANPLLLALLTEREMFLAHKAYAIPAKERLPRYDSYDYGL